MQPLPLNVQGRLALVLGDMPSGYALLGRAADRDPAAPDLMEDWEAARCAPWVCFLLCQSAVYSLPSVLYV